MKNEVYPAAKRPWTVVNMAMTADGKIATAGREVTSFGSARDLAELYGLRATVDAVLCGARTVEETGATLGNGGEKYGLRRLSAGLSVAPLRILVSGSASISLTAPLWEQKSAPVVVLVSGDAPMDRVRRLRERADAVWESPGAEIDFQSAWEWIASKWQVKRMACEGGGVLNARLFQTDLVDELRVTLCPRIFAGVESPSLADGPAQQLWQARRFKPAGLKRVGEELFLKFLRVPSAAAMIERGARDPIGC
jgi:riboflavin-specific deaminase-like protein